MRKRHQKWGVLTCWIAPLIAMGYVWSGPQASAATPKIHVSLKAPKQVQEQATYRWFVLLMKRRGFVLSPSVARSRLHFSVRWQTVRKLRAERGKLQQQFRLRPHSDHRHGAWHAARTAVNFIDFFMDYMTANTSTKQQTEWKQARAQLQQTPSTPTAKLLQPRIPTPKVTPQPRRTVPRMRPIPRRELPRPAPLLIRRQPKPRIVPRRPTRPTPTRTVTRPRPRSRPTRLAAAASATFTPAPQPSPFGFSIDLGGSLALPGQTGIGLGGGLELALSWKGWRLGLLLLARYGVNEEDEQSAFLIQPALLIGTPPLDITNNFSLALNIGAGAEVFYLRLYNDASWQPRLGFIFEMMGLVKISQQWHLSIRTGLNLSPTWLEISHPYEPLNVAQWTTSIRLGIHWKLF